MRWVQGIAVAALGVVAVLLSLLGGVPAKLPGAAMGSEEMLHVERSVALFAAFLLVFIVVWRAFQGHLPDEISGRGLKWTPRETTDEVRQASAIGIEELRTSLGVLRDATGQSLAELLRAVESVDAKANQAGEELRDVTDAVEALDRRLEALET